MQIIKTASGKKTLKMNRKEWTTIGKQAKWLKIAQSIQEETVIFLTECLQKLEKNNVNYNDKKISLEQYNEQLVSLMDGLNSLSNAVKKPDVDDACLSAIQTFKSTINIAINNKKMILRNEIASLSNVLKNCSIQKSVK